MLFAGFNVARASTRCSRRSRGVLGEPRRLVDRLRVGYYGRIDCSRSTASKLHIKPSHLEWADRWFERYGEATVFFTRMLPIVRTFISLPAGVARMPFWRFTLFTLLGCIPWVFALAFIGKQAGDNWDDWKDSLHYVDYAVLALIVVGIVYLVVRWRRRRAAAEARGR
jgi:membrane protein DedA with SNARE-associated domain